MQNALYTAGPWQLNGWRGSLRGEGVCDQPDLHVAVWTSQFQTMICPCGPVDDAESVATAKVIAAAPELVAALQSLLSQVEMLGLSPDIVSAMAAAYSALGKAGIYRSSGEHSQVAIIPGLIF